ncbi:MAG TPA: hypothetical protein VES60_00420 [Nakamurella sp.]|nr:hypothetical protein [Nakamurella sp.]
MGAGGAGIAVLMGLERGELIVLALLDAAGIWALVAARAAASSV